VKKTRGKNGRRFYVSIKDSKTDAKRKEKERKNGNKVKTH